MLGGAVRSIAGGVRGWAVGKVKAAIKKAASILTAPGRALGGSGGVSRYAGIAASVLKMLGEPAGALPSVMHRMMRESHGRVSAVNRTDSNWSAGHPSVGLMQVIRGTFGAYAGPYRNKGPFVYGVSTNPLANIYAGLNYAKHRYGSVMAGMNQAGGYDSGGIARGIGYLAKRTVRPERVLSPRQTISFERLTDALVRAPMLGRSSSVNASTDRQYVQLVVGERTMDAYVLSTSEAQQSAKRAHAHTIGRQKP
jgi:SLT domain-containing protein